MAEIQPVFHKGELTLQGKANVPEDYLARASNFIRAAMPEQHRTFFESLPVMYLGALDKAGRVWSVPVFGEPGFIKSPEADQLTLNSKPIMVDELGLEVSAGAKIGALGVELHTRRRNRVNGTLAETNEGMLLSVDQSFGNCPKYIQTRNFNLDAAHSTSMKAHKLDGFSDKAKNLIARADTFFIASRVKDISEDPRAGIDSSHRGGKPGFLALNDDSTLSFPDFFGNRFFNTLGNIEDDGRVGLFIPDFDSGDAVFLTGRATVDWEPERIGVFKGAERIIDITSDEIWFAENAIPGSGVLIELSPSLRSTGNWDEEVK